MKDNSSREVHMLVSGFTSNYGGVEMFIYNHYTNMEYPRIKMDIITHARKPAYQKELEELGVQFYYIPVRSKHPMRYRKAMREFFSKRVGRYDIFWCNKCMLNNIDFLQYATKYKVPIRILHSHNSSNMETGVKGKLMQWMHHRNQRKLSLYVTEYWACSDLAAQWMFSNLIQTGTQYTFIPNAVAAEKFRINEVRRQEVRQQLGIECKYVIGHIGRFHFQKNHEFLLQIFEKVYEKNKDAILLLIGAGELEQAIREQTKELQLDHVVRFLGVRHDIPDMMQAMDCFVLPSRFEGLPIVAVEAQAAGLPCVLARDGITKQVQITEYVTFLSLNQSAQEWAEVILSEEGQKEDTLEILTSSGFHIVESAKRMNDRLMALLVTSSNG